MYKEFNKRKFLKMCETTFQFCFNLRDRKVCLWAIQQIWKDLSSDPEILKLKVPYAVGDIPGNPLGQEGQYGRRSTAHAYTSIKLRVISDLSHWA